ncbi:MAG: MiaB/RimO family radical SAM methylthiotransferase [bacterium]
MKAYLRTFGCRANQYDTEAVRAMVLAAGGECVDDARDADVIVMNSCAVTAEAEADLRQALRRSASESTANGRAPTPAIVMGCASARDDGRLRAIPGVQALVSGADMEAVAEALGLDRTAALTPMGTQSGSRALLRVQDGCDEHCTFCATTLARGANRSRAAESLVSEALRLAESHPEIVLTGVHIGTYGHDLGTSLGALVTLLVDRVPDVRFRLTSIEATEVDAELAAHFRDGGRRVAPHLHAPLQSGADAVLRRMGRHWYTAATYRTAIEQLVADRSVFALSGDVITGFPGETADDHAQTVALVRDLPFTALHVFPYSARPGTAAERLGGAVPGPLARERAAELRTLVAGKTAAYAAQRAGGHADVVVIGPGPSRHGLTEDYLSVTLSEPMPPRGARFDARLVADASGLRAITR